MTALVVALALVVLLLAVLVAGVLRSHAEILKALHDLGAGLDLDAGEGPVAATQPGVQAPRRPDSTAPEAVLGETLDGEQVALPLRGALTLLAFLSSTCTTCQDFWSAFAQAVPATPGGARLAVITRDLSEESRRRLEDRAPAQVPLVCSSQTWDALDVPGSPYFLLIDTDGAVIGEGSGASWPQVVDLLAQAHQDQPGSGLVRERRDDAALRAAGIEPGHPSLHEAS